MALTRTLTFNLTATLTGTITSTAQEDNVPLNYTQEVSLAPGAYQVTGTLTVPEGGEVTFAFINPELTTTRSASGVFGWIVTITTQTTFTAVSSGAGAFALDNLLIEPYVIDEL